MATFPASALEELLQTIQSRPTVLARTQASTRIRPLVKPEDHLDCRPLAATSMEAWVAALEVLLAPAAADAVTPTIMAIKKTVKAPKEVLALLEAV